MKRTYWIAGFLILIILVFWILFNQSGRTNEETDFTAGDSHRADSPMSEIVGIEEYSNPFLLINRKGLPYDATYHTLIEKVYEIEARLVKEKGLAWTDSYISWKSNGAEYSASKLPRLQINLFMETQDGRVVPMVSSGIGMFEWMTDKYSVSEYDKLRYTSNFENAVSYTLLANMDPDPREKWMDDHGLESFRARPWGIKEISIPILPVNFTKKFPELAKVEDIVKLFRPAVRAGEWYRFVVHGGRGISLSETLQGTIRRRVTYIRTPDAEDLEMGKVIVMNHVFRQNEQPPIDFTNRYTKEQIAKGLHLKETFIDVNVNVNPELFSKESKLRAVYCHNIPSRGFLNSDILSRKQLSCTYRVSQVRRGGIFLAKVDDDVVTIPMAVRNIKKGQTDVSFPDDADYVLKNPVSCRVAIPTDLKEILGTAFDSYLHIGINDGAPVAMGKPEDGGQSVEFKANEGEYYIRFLKTPDLICPGKVTIQKDASEVTIKPLTEDEHAKWEKHWALLKSRHPLAKE